MLRTTLTVIAWILGIAAALAAIYFAFQKWGSEKRKAQVKKWASDRKWKTTKEKIKAGEVKESYITCSSCGASTTHCYTYCPNCATRLKEE